MLENENVRATQWYATSSPEASKPAFRTTIKWSHNRCNLLTTHTGIRLKSELTLKSGLPVRTSLCGLFLSASLSSIGPPPPLPVACLSNEPIHYESLVECIVSFDGIQPQVAPKLIAYRRSECIVRSVPKLLRLHLHPRQPYLSRRC